MNAFQIIGIALGVVVLLAMTLVLFLAAQAGGYGALSRWLQRSPVDLDQADGVNRRSQR